MLALPDEAGIQKTVKEVDTQELDPTDTEIDMKHKVLFCFILSICI